MELISLGDTVNYLSASAPRPWLRRMLLWMILQGELDLFVRIGRIVPRVSLLQFYLEKFGELPNDHEREELVRSKFDKDFADELLSLTPLDLVDDAATEWGEDEEAHKIGPGYLLTAESVMNWDKNSMTGEITFAESEVGLYFWDSDEHLGSNFREPDYEFSFNGLCFSREKIELLQPSVELEKRGTVDARVRPGRPRVWDWDGALLHLVSVAQQPDGLPVGAGAQAHVERLISEWFSETAGNSPSPSQIRQHAARVMRTIGKPVKPESR